MSVVFETYRSVFDRSAAERTDYPWDAWRSASYYYFIDIDLAPRLGPVSDTAIAGFALAACEWVCARLWPHPEVAEVLEFIDAAWARLLRQRRGRWLELPYDDWQGPVRGPLRGAQLIAGETVFDAIEDHDLVARACWASNLAKHVIDGPEKAAFEDWTSFVCDQLEALHPYEMPVAASLFDNHFPPPAPVPPAAFCHRPAYDPSRVAAYISDHLSRLGPLNRYLGPD